MRVDRIVEESDPDHGRNREGQRGGQPLVGPALAEEVTKIVPKRLGAGGAREAHHLDVRDNAVAPLPPAPSPCTPHEPFNRKCTVSVLELSTGRPSSVAGWKRQRARAWR